MYNTYVYIYMCTHMHTLVAYELQASGSRGCQAETGKSSGCRSGLLCGELELVSTIIVIWVAVKELNLSYHNMDI